MAGNVRQEIIDSSFDSKVTAAKIILDYFYWSRLRASETFPDAIHQNMIKVFNIPADKLPLIQDKDILAMAESYLVLAMGHLVDTELIKEIKQKAFTEFISNLPDEIN